MASRTYDHDWQTVRGEILERDGHRCRIRGPKCEGDADQVDHIVPVEDGGARLDPANLRAACGWCNRWRANRQKAADGWRRASTHLVLVVGPPGGGKSTYVADRAGPSDLVVDYDEIARALGSPLEHGHADPLHEVVSAARNAVLSRIRRGEVAAPRAWILSSNPAAESIFPHHEVVEVDPGREEALARCADADRPAKWAALVDDWYRRREAIGGPSRPW